MLSQFYEFVFVNNSTKTLTLADGASLNLKRTNWFIDPETGLISYVQAADVDFSIGATMDDGDELISATVDNTVLKFIGAQLQLEVAMDLAATSSGSFDLYISDGDASGELETDASGYLSAETNLLTHVGTLNIPAGLTNDDLLRSPTWNI